MVTIIKPKKCKHILITYRFNTQEKLTKRYQVKQKGGCPNQSSFFACRSFLIFVRPLFSFLAQKAIFLRALFSPSFFGYFPTILAPKPCFELFFLNFCSHPLSALLFFSLESALFFLFLLEGTFFSALFQPSLLFFFCALVSI